CHPGTREQYVMDIVSWGAPAIGAGEPLPLPLYWVKGLIGVGKSAIAQTRAEKFNDPRKPGATFFFSANEQDNAAQLPAFRRISRVPVSCRPEGAPR
ncbi:hypothetical protein P691DRAFT_661736, partial [Macrolepiota fuliginosa MF-IS2]